MLLKINIITIDYKLIIDMIYDVKSDCYKTKIFVMSKPKLQ